ncbi:MAG: MFS transporter [Rothia sp. (in: high G+C Gram-positive bacteria)]|nr:MFS transporter [Rothia sp. (in: high G+C Gram-positive bacteria)]
MSQQIPSPSMDTGALPIIPQEARISIPAQKQQEPVKVPLQLKILISASFLIALGYGLVAPVLPGYARSFDVGALAATFVVSAFALSRLLFAPASGRLISRLGERRIYTSGLLIVGLGSIGAGLAPNYWVLILSRIVGGLGSVMFTVAAMGILVRYAPPTIRGRVSGYFATSFLLGNILGPVLGAAASSWGMRVPFFVYATMLLLASLVVLTFLKEPQGQELDTAGLKQVRPVLSLAEAWQFTNYKAALLANFAVGWSVFGVQSTVIPLAAMALVAGQGEGLSADQLAAAGAQLAGFTLATYAAGNALVQIYSGKLGDRVGRRPLVFSGLLLAGLLTIVYGFVAGSSLLFVLLAAFLGVASALLGPSLQAAVSDVIGSGRSGGQPLAYFQMVSDVGLILGPLLAGFLIDRWGFLPAFWVAGLLLLLAAVAWFPAYRPRFPQDLAEAGYSGR